MTTSDQATTMTETARPLRELPAPMSLPLIGDTLAFIADTAGYLAKRTRDLGPVFRIDVFGKPTACFVGPEALSVFLDERNVVRDGANPPHVEEIFNPKAVPFLDGDAHRRRKKLLLEAFTDDALASYLPMIERVVGRFARRWVEIGPFEWVPELTSMGYAIAGALFVGSDPDVDDATIEEAFERAAAGLLAPPIRLPFTTFGRALKSRDYLLGVVDAALDAREGGERKADLLQRLIDARVGKEKLSREELRIETFHFFGAYAAVIGGLSFLGQLLAQHPDVAARAREEIEAEHGGTLTLGDLQRMRYLDAVCKESRRVSTVVPITFFGRVRRECSFRGYRIPEGMKAIGCLDATMHDAQTFGDPSKFDPDRWRKAGNRQAEAWVPHGAGAHASGHRCAGEKLATLMLKVFAIQMLRGYTWQLTPGQDLTPTRGKLFATPSGGLRVRVTRRHA